MQPPPRPDRGFAVTVSILAAVVWTLVMVIAALAACLSTLTSLAFSNPTVPKSLSSGAVWIWITTMGVALVAIIESGRAMSGRWQSARTLGVLTVLLGIAVAIVADGSSRIVLTGLLLALGAALLYAIPQVAFYGRWKHETRREPLPRATVRR